MSESSLIASTTMDAARALADLVEISPQIEAAAVMAGDGRIVGTFGVPEARVDVLARLLGELIAGAGDFHRDGGRVTQLHAELAGGQVFAVTGADDLAIVAVTGGRAAPGLVFYDLKRCLAAVADEA
jgi:predicted regulator of Ras-like GTPase activity (Roadblock/LC7/MglB family)